MAMDRNPEVGDIINARFEHDSWEDVIITKVIRQTEMVYFVKYEDKDKMNPFEWYSSFDFIKAGDLVGVCKVQKTELYFTHDEVFFEK